MSLEFVLLLPLVALLLLVVFEAIGVARDVVVAQDLARQGARVAAVEWGDAAAVRVVHDLVPDAEVRVAPPGRAAGDQVTVEVRLVATMAGIDVPVTASATAMVEPGGAA